MRTQASAGAPQMPQKTLRSSIPALRSYPDGETSNRCRPIPGASKQTTRTQAAVNAKTTETLGQLQAGIAALTTSEAWTAWLETQRRFHQYSFGNCLLMGLQRPGATRVAGFHAWRKLGRPVMKGEKGIAILAPIVTRTRIEDEETGEVRVAISSPHGFRVVHVFDIGQTAGRELPDAPCSRLQGEDPGGVFAGLMEVATRLGYTVEFVDFQGAKNGECSFLEHRIRLSNELSPAMRCKTLAHELAHAILHGSGFASRQVAELEAESTAYLVRAHLGIDSAAYSFGYVASWAGGGKEAIDAISACGQRIAKAARMILGQDDQAPASLGEAA